MGAKSRVYLAVYNLIQLVLWSYALFKMIKTHFLDPEPSKVKNIFTNDTSTYDKTAWIVGKLQKVCSVPFH
jgi:hypothetical protein